MPLKRSNKIALLVCILFTSLFVFRYLTHKTTFYGDAAGYYRYLTATFIYDDLITYRPLPRDRGLSDMVLNYDPTPESAPDDKHVNQYTYGVALMEAPFFLLAHAYELVRGSLANGYSDSYELAIKISSLVYALLGLMLVYRVLRRFFDETPALYTTLLLLLGTNLFWFAIFQTGMSHVPLFFLYALLMYLTVAVHDRPRRGTFIAMGLVIGLIAIIRPTDIICAIIPLLYDVYSGPSLRKKIAFIRQNLLNICLTAAAAILPVLPQLLYWKIKTGHFFYYSYGSQTFFWDTPWIKEGLFHFANGWLPYTPLMALALLGMLCLRPIKQWALAVWLLLPAYIYIIYSWYCYRYINGLGSRPMLHMYPLLSVPLTAFLLWLWRRPRAIKAATMIGVLFCIALNINYSYQQMKGLLWSEESNWKFNYQMLFKTQLTYDDLVVNDIDEFQPDTSKLVRIGTFAREEYNDSTIADHTVVDPITGHKYVYHLLNGEEHQRINLSVPYDKQRFAGAKWIKCSGRFMCPESHYYFRHLLVLSVDGKLWKGAKIENKIFDTSIASPMAGRTLFSSNIRTWGRVHYFVRIPEGLNEHDMIKLFAWSTDLTEIYVDDLTIELYK
ncbi:glycosyltransferase family 39 protein [Nemorincola caseinilytica]